MKDRAYLGHAAIAVVAIGLAAVAAWAPSAASEESAVVVVPGQPEGLSSIELHEELFDVAVARAKAGGDGASAAAGPEEVRVTVTRREKPGKDGVTPPAVSKSYPGTKQAKELFGQLAPLKAARSLGAIDAARLKSLGLDAPVDNLVLRFDGEARKVELGAATYGSGDRYARGPSGEIFLLQAKTISSLKNGASALLERRALAVETEAIRRISISAGARGREVIQRYAEEAKKAFFADPAEPETKLEQVSNWIDRVLKLRLADVNAEAPSGPPALDLEVFNGSRTLGRLELWEPKGDVALARSSAFDAPISIAKANAEAVLRDLEAVLAEGR